MFANIFLSIVVGLIIYILIVSHDYVAPVTVVPLKENPVLADCVYTTADPYKNGSSIPVIRCPNSTVVINEQRNY